MGRTISRPGEDDILKGFSDSTGFYSAALNRHYSITKKGDKYYHGETRKNGQGETIYTVEEALAYSVGAGVNGWSYLISIGDRLYMSPLTYYSRKRRWDLSPGYSNGTFSSFSRPVSSDCLVCHSGRPNPVAGTVNVYGQPLFQQFSIGCERCHGPGSEHVARVGDGESDPDKLAIANPAKLTGLIRDNICDQCHLRGDARVNQPGRSLLDFRAGEPLDNSVAVFSVPLQYEGKAFPGISHSERLRSSRCWTGSQGALGCVSCHNPHQEPAPEEKIDHYRKSCLKCHGQDACAASLDLRKATQPADNCLECHMPRRPFEGVPHSSGTEHRISRFPEDDAPRPDQLHAQEGARLAHLTGTTTTSRTLALAYAEAAQTHVQYRAPGYQLLERAIAEYPGDLQLNETFGLIQLRVSQSRESIEKAARLLQKAVDLGSASGAVHHTLAAIRLREGRVQEAVKLLREGIKFEPHHSPSSILLAEVAARGGDTAQARKIAERALDFNPGDKELRDVVESYSVDDEN